MISVEEVRRYNRECQKAQNEANQALAKKEVIEQELQRLCAQLTQMLGKQVTLDNFEQVYEEASREIENLVKNGNSLLQRVKLEAEQAQPQQAQPQQAQQAQQAQQGFAQTPVQQFTQPASEAWPPTQQAQTQQATQFAQAWPGFGQQAPQQVQQGSLPVYAQPVQNDNVSNTRVSMGEFVGREIIGTPVNNGITQI